jgi:hypothetical protein
MLTASSIKDYQMTELTYIDGLDLEKEFGHWGEHPDFPVSDWQDEVASDETRLGYWIWVEVKINDEN